MKNIIFYIITFLSFTTIAQANMTDADKKRAYDCSGIYMANYFLPSGETFEYSMKEKSMASVKVLKTYALEIGIDEKEWDDGVEYGREQGRLDVFEDLLKIKYVTWSVHSVNNKEWSLGDKNLDHPLDLNVDKPLKIIFA